MHDTLLLAGSAKSPLADFAAFACRPGRRIVAVSGDEDLSRADFQPTRAVVFVGRRLTPQVNAVLAALAQGPARTSLEQLILISTFAAHLGDERAGGAEREALAPFQGLPVQIVVFRAGHVLSTSSSATATLRRLGFAWPLVPARLSSCFLDGDELFAAIEHELSRPVSKSRTYAIPGPRRSWRDVLRQSRPTGLLPRLLTLVLALPALLGVGHLLYFLMRRRLGDPDTLYPRSPQELLSLYNRYSFRHVKIVGYNNGVVHFGHQYPGKTLVSTIHCSRIAWIKGDRIKLDAGTTIRQAVAALAGAGKELYVVPNYSYVSIGTSFFVPIHGSASDFCTLAETIDRVLLYDPVEDRLVRAGRSSPAFGHYLYNLSRDVLLLRLSLRVKDKSVYYRKQTRVAAPTSEQIIALLTDPRPSNVEIRKAQSGQDTIDVYQYYNEPQPGDAEALAFPRDELGKLWDRLESNRLTAAMFHGLVRRLAHHVELFIPLEEFGVFWSTHAALPIRKIQLRYIKRDGCLHSPFAKHDCISADLFMLKKHKQAFEQYVKTTFRGVSHNPGKHSS
jgi:hypothetical protein